MLLNGGGWGNQVWMAALLRERGYLLEEGEGRRQRPVDARPELVVRGAPRGRPAVLRHVFAGLALVLRLVPRW